MSNDINSEASSKPTFFSEPDVNGPRILPLSNLLNEWKADAEAAAAAKATGVPRGPVTGIKGVDEALGGYLAPGFHSLQGEPGTGKTALALQIAATCGTPALFVSCEMGPLELFRRLTARTTGTYLGRLKSGELAPLESLALATETAKRCANLAILDSTVTPVPAWSASDEEPRGILEFAKYWRERCGGTQCLLVIDSLHTWAHALAVGAAEYEALNASIDELRTIAHLLGSPVLAVAEQTKSSMGSSSQSAGAGTRRIAYQGETVLSLKRELDSANNWSDAKTGAYPISLELAKNRHGACGRAVKLEFVGKLQQFTEDTTR